ncbi:MAG: ABC transporter permease [Gemmatimonadota bacterium]|nr:MAG: ABC transporter permease [Gemmatimonadota bacterium]
MTDPSGKCEPPRCARSLLRLLVRRAIGKEYELALDELFEERSARDGIAKARKWYWRQVFGFVVRRRSFRRITEPGTHRRAVVTASLRRGSVLEALVQDARLCVRRFRSEPTFVATVAITLSLGIGASTAVFGVLSTTLLSRIPYAEPDRLIIGRTVYIGAPGRTFNGVSIPNYSDYRESSRSFESLAAVMDGINRVTVTGGDEVWSATTSYATWNLFRTLGVNPAVGRHFLPEEEHQEDLRVAIISFGLWRGRFGGDQEVLGRTMVLEGTPHTIVGVLPRGFRFLWDADVWRVAVRPGAARNMNAYYVLGRLRPDVSMALAQSEVTTISEALEREYPEANETSRLHLTSLQDFLGGGVRRGLLLPAVATACLLLIACANVAGLLLVRGQRRLAEMTMRSALGASRWRLVRQQLAESVLLTLPAGLLGVGVAYLLQPVLLHIAPMGLLGVSEPVVDGPVLLFVVAATLATGLLAGAVPALRGSAVAPLPHLGVGQRTPERHGGSRMRSGLVALQIAISVVLLVGSGLIARSLLHLSNVDLGFSTEQVYTAGVRIPSTVNQERSGDDPFFAEVLREIRDVPGVQSAGAISRWPVQSPGGIWPMRAANRPLSEGEHGERAYLRRISPGYFRTVDMPLQRGRDFLETDREETPGVAVLSESLAARLYPGEDPVGQSVILITPFPNRPEIPFEIVGVVQNARLNSPRVSGDPVLYLSALQARPTAMGIAIRSDGNPTVLFRSIREIVRRAEPDALITGVAPMGEIIDESLADFRRMARYLGLFAGIALLLAAVALYGAMSYHVTQQEHEIGVRVAVGETRPGIIGLVLRRGAGIVAVGLAVGLTFAYPGTTLVRDLLFETVPFDPTTYIGAVLVLTMVAAAACVLPAMRATRVDPAILLRGE